MDSILITVFLILVVGAVVFRVMYAIAGTRPGDVPRRPRRGRDFDLSGPGLGFMAVDHQNNLLHQSAPTGHHADGHRHGPGCDHHHGHHHGPDCSHHHSHDTGASHGGFDSGGGGFDAGGGGFDSGGGGGGSDGGGGGSN